MKDILAVIVTFNPKIDILKNNYNILVKQCNNIIIVDNGSENIQEIKNILNNSSNLIENGSNKGIAFALNRALYYAENKNYKYILTMDQDSEPAFDMLQYLYEAISSNDNLSIVGSCIIDKNSQHVLKISSEIEERQYIITSGSLCKVSDLLKVGGFLEKLFIDYVDFEMCLRLLKNQYELYVVKKAQLYHELGNSKMIKLPIGKLIINNHSPFRRYYYFRNKLYVIKKYFHAFPKKMIAEIFDLIKKVIIIILFERNRKENIKNIFRGLVDANKI